MYSSKIQVNENKIRECVDYPERFAPIKLTEEWLLKFGFSVRKSLGFEAYDLDDTYTIYYNTTATPYGFELSFGVDFEIEIKHVHQLQNLYFALTGDELELKQHEAN